MKTYLSVLKKKNEHQKKKKEVEKAGFVLFLLFSPAAQKAISPGMRKKVLIWDGLMFYCFWYVVFFNFSDVDSSILWDGLRFF